MVRRLGLVGKKEETQKILDGTWTPTTKLYKDTKDILLRTSKIQTLKAFEDIKVDITRESFRSHGRRSRGNMASSISVFHFGHYKLASSSALLSYIHTIFFPICTTSGLFTPYWSVGIKVILVKEPRDFFVHKLRAIIDMEKYYNSLAKYLIIKFLIPRGE